MPAYEDLTPVDQELSLLIRARFPILSVVTHEEWRVLAQLEGVRDRLIQDRTATLNNQLARATTDAERQQLQQKIDQIPGAHQILRWTAIDGLCHWSLPDKRGRPLRIPGVENTKDPISLLVSLRFPPEKAVEGVDLRSALFVFCDLHAWLDRDDRAARFNHILVRALRDIARRFKLSVDPTALILLSPRLVVPMELNKEMQVIDYPLPTGEQMNQRFQRLRSQMEQEYGEGCVKLSEAAQLKLSQALRGLTYDEAENVLARSLANNGVLEVEDIAEILEQKRQIIRKDGTLDYFDSEKGLDDVGGLEKLIRWLGLRRRAFEGGKVVCNGKEVPLPDPKGILLIGVPGCGKSLVAKVVGRAWELPLLRLDIGRIFAGTVGQSEENMRRAIRVAESVAPAIMWLDEVEKAFPRSTGAGDAGTSLRVMNTFLTWLQEKKAPVFVIATGNDISQVPPELSRKGRFDEIFYVGLPDAAARRRILEIHTKEYPLPADDIELLTERSKYFTGAEIEQSIKNALYQVEEYAGEDLAPDTPGGTPLGRAISAAMKGFVPLATREEEGNLIVAKTLQSARSLAIPASDHFEDLPDRGDAVAARRNWDERERGFS